MLNFRGVLACQGWLFSNDKWDDILKVMHHFPLEGWEIYNESIGKTNIYYVTWIELLISKINKHVITDNYSWYLESKSHTLYKWGKQQNLDGTSWLGGYLESSPFLFCEEEKLTFPKPYHPWDWHISLQVPSKSTNVSKCSVSTTIHSWMVRIISHTWVCPRDDQSTVFPRIGKQERIVRTCYVPLVEKSTSLYKVGRLAVGTDLCGKLA